MTRRRFALALCCATLCGAGAHPLSLLAATEDADDVLWTTIIPDAFPRNIYTWHIRSDGSYREDGRDALNGSAVQATLSGRWRIEGARMVMRQQGIPYVFDGMVVGEVYGGTLYFDGRAVSRFCAAKGARAPSDCGQAPEVATETRP